MWYLEKSNHTLDSVDHEVSPELVGFLEYIGELRSGHALESAVIGHDHDGKQAQGASHGLRSAILEFIRDRGFHWGTIHQSYTRTGHQ